MAALSAEQIELINAYGPYNHAVWSAPGLEISNEERLRGRGDFLVKHIRECIMRHFSPDEIKNLSVLDVGCYDGWILHQLSDLPFARMVGVEPREKNIAKGKKVREILNIPSNIEFRIGDIDSLGQESFDIVICTGVLHHLESIPRALRRLRSVCRQMLFLETACLSSKHLTKAVHDEVEMKDVVYQYKDRTCGLTAQKLESSYYDGSSAKLSVVSVPSLESLMMYLDTAGFYKVEVVVDVASYRRAVLAKSERSVNAVCLCAFARSDQGRQQLDELFWVGAYESGLAQTIISKQHIEPLYQIYCRGRRGGRWSQLGLIIWLYLRSSDRFARLWLYLIPLWLTDKYTTEIIKNLRFNPEDKLRLEYGKILFHEGQKEKASAVLKAITQKINADWRSVYRSFYLLSRIYQDLGDIPTSLKYKELCLTCNPNFPKAFFTEG
jgi:ubiquinone/menaquinone biosynthesis C-methylase UbiE